MSDFSRVSRRKFLATAGASAAASILLKDCLGNPPEANTASAPASEAVADIDISSEQMPETSRVKLGYIPIVEEAAALVIAHNQGGITPWISCPIS